MKLIMMPVIFTAGFLIYQQHDKIADLYRAAYPTDPVKAAELNTCAENTNFNRLDSADRESCYTGTYGRREAPALIPTPQPTYVYSPSHLPGNDIRRQEANSSYLQGAPGSPHPPSPHPTPPHPTPPSPYNQHDHQQLGATLPTTITQQ